MSRTNIPAAELQALQDLYDATRGDHWMWRTARTGSKWNFTSSSNNPCTDNWQGITCTSRLPYFVEQLALPSYRMFGTIPSSLSDLSHLTLLDLSFNLLKGELPASLGNLTSLQSLFMNHNELTGAIPDCLGLLHQLEILDLQLNFLHGTIPFSFGNLAALSALNLDTNYLSGTLPANIGNLTNLEFLEFGNNFLHGTLPASLGQLLNLKEFQCNVNMLTGHIPTSFGNLTRLIDVYLYNNSLSGSIPETLGQLKFIEWFEASANQLTGTIPPSLGNWRLTTHLILYANSLHGEIPASLGQIKSLNTLWLYDNYLTGTISTNLSQLSNLRDLELSNNLLEGTVPRSFSALTELSLLRLFNNFLSGNLERVFDPVNQPQLAYIQVNDNQFTGPLPGAVFLLPLLNTFTVTSNCFDGTLPDTICNATSLVNLVADGLSAASQCKRPLWPGVSRAYTSAHPVHGTIPVCVFALPNLTTLHLSGNRLSGSIPANVTLSPTIQDLSLSYNILTGSIPLVIQERQWTVNLDLSYNRLGGTLSAGMPAAANRVTALSLQNNRLSGHIPAAVAAMTNVSILGSNLFSCALDGGGLPQHDATSRDSVAHYQCGSSVFELWYYLWLGLTVMGVLLVVGVLHRCLWTSVGWNGWIRKCDESAKQVALLFRELDSIVFVGGLCTSFVIVALVPLYLALRTSYATQVHAYAWSVSAGFLSGELPFALLVVFWALLLVFLVFFSSMFTNWFDARDKESDFKVNPDRVWVNVWWEKALVTAVFIVVNFVVVVGVNVGYVVVVIGQSSDLLIVVQVLMSFFKLGWNNGCATFLMQKTVQYVHGVDHDASVRISRNAFTALRIGVTLLNTIAIPCGVVAAIAPACFYNLFVSTNPVISAYLYRTCWAMSPSSGICKDYILQISRSTYHPPFAYNYQCSSSLVTYYAPTFVNLCITNTFVTPLLQVAALWLYRRASPATCGGWWARLLRCFVPTIMLPISSTESSVEMTGETVVESSTYPCLFRPYRLLDGNQLVVTLVGYLGLLLTFGAVFPPLAVAVAVTLAAVTLCARLRVGRFLSAAEAQSRADLVAALEQELRGRRAAAVLRRALWMLVTVSCWFYTLFLFDTLGDSVGFERAYWVLVVFPLLPVVLYLFSVLYNVVSDACKVYKKEHESADNNNTVELSTIGGDTHNVLHA